MDSKPITTDDLSTHMENLEGLPFGWTEKIAATLTARQVVHMDESWDHYKAKAAMDTLRFELFQAELAQNLVNRDLNRLIKLGAFENARAYDRNLMGMRCDAIEAIDKKVRDFRRLVDLMVWHWENLIKLGVYTTEDINTQITFSRVLERVNECFLSTSYISSVDREKLIDPLMRANGEPFVDWLNEDCEKLQKRPDLEEFISKNRPMQPKGFEDAVFLLWHAAKKAHRRISRKVFRTAPLIRATRLIERSGVHWQNLDWQILESLNEVDREYYQTVLNGPEALRKR